MCSKYSKIYLLKDTKDISSRYLNVKIYAAKIHCYFWRAQTYLSFIFNLLFYFYYEWNHRVVFLKVWVKVDIFDWVSFLLNFTFLLDKMHGVFGKFFISFKTKIMEKLNTNLSIKLWFLSCNKMFWNPIISLWVWARHKLITRQLFYRHLSTHLFLKLIWKHSLKERKCKFKTDDLSHSKALHKERFSYQNWSLCASLKNCIWKKYQSLSFVKI